ncbi:MAG: hypothetical protein LBH46_02665 [Rickettsiales bacterium]|jgi:superoxide reductase|nr:hypothetical protein [Rickettsiales bacterium]
MKMDIYKCDACGKVVGVEIDGHNLSAPVCCGKAMIKQEAKTTEVSAAEKHVPVVEMKDGGVLVMVGSVEHPSAPEHYIQWVEIIDGDFVYKKYLNPGDRPEVFFENIKSVKFVVREYCNLHGLWSLNVG